MLMYSGSLQGTMLLAHIMQHLHSTNSQPVSNGLDTEDHKFLLKRQRQSADTMLLANSAQEQLPASCQILIEANISELTLQVLHQCKVGQQARQLVESQRDTRPHPQQVLHPAPAAKLLQQSPVARLGHGVNAHPAGMNMPT
jgi:hypothetical protein